jgi:hypothetical protein
MCAVNRISSEPPSHHGCAEFAAIACPFLARPKAQRRDVSDLPHKPAAGIMIERNPGVTLLWTTKSYQLMRAPGGVLFELGDPTGVAWYREGRAATREEVLESIDSGLPTLRELAEQDGANAVAMLEKATAEAMKLLPQGGQHER